MTHIDRRHSQTEDRYAADDLETMQLARRYAGHIFDLFRPHIGARVLEVGCGIGTMTQRLLQVADRVVAIEPNENCAALTRSTIGAHPRFSMRECPVEQCDPDELARHGFDTVFCVNVLEHIEDDVAALRLFRDAIVPGGRVLVFVPAVPAAYGPLDAELGHHRRYTKSSLRRAFALAALDLAAIRYTNPIGLAGWMVNAHIRKTRAHSPGQVVLFDRFIAPWALPLERLVAPPIGLSLVAVGVKA